MFLTNFNLFLLLLLKGEGEVWHIYLGYFLCLYFRLENLYYTENVSHVSLIGHEVNREVSSGSFIAHSLSCGSPHLSNRSVRMLLIGLGFAFGTGRGGGGHFVHF